MMENKSRKPIPKREPVQIEEIKLPPVELPDPKQYNLVDRIIEAAKTKVPRPYMAKINDMLNLLSEVDVTDEMLEGGIAIAVGLLRKGMKDEFERSEIAIAVGLLRKGMKDEFERSEINGKSSMEG